MNEEKLFVTKAMLPSYETYIEAIKPLWDSHWITNMGEYHKRLEDNIKVFLEVPEVSLMVNGHMALELLIQSMDFPSGAEVITTPFTFISTTHAIIRNNLTPVFCDVKESDGTIDESKIEGLITKKTVAIVAVHVYGNICNVEALQRIADKYHLKIIYDAAHSFGERYKGIGIGNFGDASIFSFHATKIYNTIEGGAVTFANKELYNKLYNLKNFGIRGEEVVEAIGSNAKMNEFSAIMGICNLTNIQKEIEERHKRYIYYWERLSKIKGINNFIISDEIERNYSYLTIIVNREEYGISRDELYDILREHNIYARKYFYPITSDQQCFNGYYKESDLLIARKLSKEVLVLPLYGELDYTSIDKVCMVIKFSQSKS